MLVDKKSWNLAEEWLSDQFPNAPADVRKAKIQALAERIQNSIEDWMGEEGLQ